MEALLQQAISNMERRGFEVVRVKTGAEAREYLLGRIETGKVVGAGGSVTLRQIEMLPALEKKGCTVYTHSGAQGDEAEALMRKARAADVYLCSVNAIAKTGQLVMIDGRGNRVGALCDGPHEVYLVVGQHKVVDGGLNAAIARIKKEATPRNCRRLGLATHCAATGNCAGMECADSSCRIIVSLDYVPRKRKITVVLTEEELGY